MVRRLRRRSDEQVPELEPVPAAIIAPSTNFNVVISSLQDGDVCERHLLLVKRTFCSTYVGYGHPGKGMTPGAQH